jgi:cytochrome c-type biogenesis protein CcmE
MKNQRKKKRIIFVGSIFAISLISLAFVITNFRENMVFFYSPSELKTPENLEKIKNHQIRVGGLVAENSIKKIDALTTEFTITDMAENLKITYVGILPDLFREKQGVVAKGKFNSETNKFFSKELLVKHDENYMPPEVAKSLEKKKSAY